MDFSSVKTKVLVDQRVHQRDLKSEAAAGSMAAGT